MQSNDTDFLVDLSAERVARFWKNVDKRCPDECWEWTGRINGRYGLWKITPPGQKQKRLLAHRVAYVFEHGLIPEGLVIDHLCRNRLCVNPAHLEVVTQRENVMRGLSPAAIQSAKTHCKHGHEFTPENTRTRKAGVRSGHRDCKECERNRYIESRLTPTDRRT